SARALSAERYYTSRVLPKGIWTGLRDSATGDLWGAARSAVMVLGLAATAAGYCVGAVCRPAAPAGGGSEAAPADGCREASQTCPGCWWWRHVSFPTWAGPRATSTRSPGGWPAGVTWTLRC